MNKTIMYATLILSLCFLVSCNHDCDPKTKNNFRQLPLAHIADLEQINSMFLRNLVLLSDSCCKNIGSAHSGRACSDPDSLRKTYFYPATKHLLKLYLPESESATLQLIDKLAPHSYYTNDDVLITNFSFRADSTVKYPVFHAQCGDSITEHYIIFQKRSGPAGSFYADDRNVTLVKQKLIKPGWTYYIIRYADN